MLYQLDDRRVVAEGDYWVAESAEVIGSVLLKNNASIWPGAILRGDGQRIEIGENSNIQDGTVIHTGRNYPTIVGNNVTVGHRVMLHGCTIGDGCIIGMSSTLLNGSQLGECSMTAAGTLLIEGVEIPPYSLVVGSPGKVIRQISPERAKQLQAYALAYAENAARFRKGLRPQDSADRPEP